MPGHYRIFDITLVCEFQLPELHRAQEQDVALSVKIGEGDPQQFATQGFELVFEWCDSNGKATSWCERSGDDYLYVFPGNATFHITGADQVSVAGQIVCFLHRGSRMRMLRHLLLNQVIPRYLATTGRLLLHAGAVTLENGKSVAFLGNSGFGKSTLVSSFHQYGAELINDDCIQLDCDENGVMAMGGLVGFRLFPDSVDAVFSGSGDFSSYTPFTDKQQIFLKSHADAKSLSPRRLDAMFLLNEPGEEPGNTVCIEPVSGSEAMIAMIHSAFSLDPSDRKMMVGNFNRVGQAIGEHLGLYRLQYPRMHERLGEVRAAVVACIESR